MNPSWPYVPGYAIAVLCAFAVGGWIRGREVTRLGYDRDPAHVWVGVGGLLGAIVGAKLGLFLFEPWSDVRAVLANTLSLDFTGKTVVGGIAGGYLGVEAIKRVVGIRTSTGDGFALALPIGQAIGRLGCLFQGCCFGTATELPWAVLNQGVSRHPTVLYEAALDVVLAGWIYAIRDRPRSPGGLFRRTLVGYALIRLVLDPWRADARAMLGPLSALQWACLGAAVFFATWIAREDRAWMPDPATARFRP